MCNENCCLFKKIATLSFRKLFNYLYYYCKYLKRLSALLIKLKKRFKTKVTRYDEVWKRDLNIRVIIQGVLNRIILDRWEMGKIYTVKMRYFN